MHIYSYIEMDAPYFHRLRKILYKNFNVIELHKRIKKVVRVWWDLYPGPMEYYYTMHGPQEF